MEQAQAKPLTAVILQTTDRLIRVGRFSNAEGKLVMGGIAIGLMPQGAVNADGMISDPELVSPAVRELLTSKEMFGETAGIVLGGRGLAAGVASLPEPAPGRMEPDIEAEIAKHVTWAPGQFVFNFTTPRPGLDPGARQAVYFAVESVPIQTGIVAMARSGLEVELADPDLAAVIRGVDEFREPGPAIGLILFGDMVTRLALVSGYKILGLRTLYFGFSDVIQDLAIAVKRDEKDVFNLLLKRHIDMSAPVEGEGKDPLVRRIRKKLEPLAAEVRQTMEELVQACGETPEKILLCGEVGRFKNLDSFFSEQMAATVTLPMPLQGIDTEPTGLSRPGLEAIGPELAAMIGAAKAALELDRGLRVNLLARPEPEPVQPEVIAEQTPSPAPQLSPREREALAQALPQSAPATIRARTPVPAAVLGLLIILAPLLFWVFLNARSGALESGIDDRMQANRDQITQSQKQQQNAAELETARKLMAPRHLLYTALSNKRMIWSLVLKEITGNLQPETVLTELDARMGKPMVLRGLTASQAVPNELAQRLEDSEWFQDVEVIRIAKERGSKKLAFEIEMTLEEWPPVAP